MFEKKKLHPISAILFTIGYIKDAFFPIILAFIIGGSGEEASTFDRILRFGIPALILIFSIIQGFISWLRFTYWVEDNELRIEHGLFVRKKRYIPFERIQSISVTEGLIQRLFRLVKISVETAGGGLLEPEAQLTAITKRDAETLQSLIKSAKVKQKAIDNEQSLGKDEEIEHEVEEQSHIVYKSSLKSIFFLALTSGGAIGVITAALAFISQFDELIPYDKIYSEARVFIASSIILFVITFLVVIVFAYLIAIIRTMFKYYDYTVEKTEKNLIITYGLLERRKMTVPIKRIQGIEMIENPLRSFFGYATLQVINEGGTDLEERGKVIICPLIKKDEIPHIINDCLPEYRFGGEFTGLPHRAKRRYMLRPLYYIALPIALGAYFFRPYGFLLLIFIPIFMLIGLISFKRTGWDLSGHQLVFRTKWIQTRTFFVLKNRIQTLEVSKNWFQRRKKLGTIYSHVMSDSGRIVDLDESQLKKIYEWYSYSDRIE